MHILNKFFDKIYCINLVKRTDRRKLITERFNNLGIEVEFYNAIDFGFFEQLKDYINEDEPDKFNSGAELGCAHSHYTVIKKAKLLGYKNILIFEDDTVFHKDFDGYIENRLNSLPSDWNIFYLTTNKWNPIRNEEWLVRDEIFKARDCFGASAYAINSNFYSTILSEMDKNFRIIDKLYMELQDTSYYNIYACYPNLTAQDYSYSDLIKKETDYYSERIITYGAFNHNDYK